jgi:hypothetical protein
MKCHSCTLDISDVCVCVCVCDGQQAAREFAREERYKNIERLREIRKKQQETIHALALVRGPTQVKFAQV